MSRPRPRLLAAFILLLSAATPFAEASDGPAFAFQDGDRFLYDLHWSFIKVGQAELVFETGALASGGPELLHATFTVRTSGIADKLFKVRDRIESWMDPKTGRPLRYTKIQREGKTERDVQIDFDWAARTATYTRNGTVNEPIAISEDTLDPLSLITALARHPFGESGKLAQAATDGKRLVMIEAELKKRERLKLDIGKLDAYRVEVATSELRGVFEKSPDASIEVWFSTDRPAIPLKMKSEVVVGSFHGELRAGFYRGEVLGNRVEDAASGVRVMRGR